MRARRMMRSSPQEGGRRSSERPRRWGRLEGPLRKTHLGEPLVERRRMRPGRCGSASGRTPTRARFLPETLECRCLKANIAGPSIPGSLVPGAIHAGPVGDAGPTANVAESLGRATPGSAAAERLVIVAAPAAVTADTR